MINDVTVHFELPSHWHMYNTFHINMFKKYAGPGPSESAAEGPPKFEEIE